jgi:hypothetical protein
MHVCSPGMPHAEHRKVTGVGKGFKGTKNGKNTKDSIYKIPVLFDRIKTIMDAAEIICFKRP